MSDRMDAIHSLVKQFKNNYPKEGFLINPSISFVENKDTTKGICVQAKHAIKSQEILLVIPESEDISKQNLHLDIKIITVLTKLMKLIEDMLHTVLYSKVHAHIFSLGVMHVLSNRINSSDCNPSSIFMKYLATLPSHLELRDEMHGLYLIDEQLDVVGGKKSFSRRQIEIKQETVKTAFQQVIFPILNNIPKNIQMLFIGSSVSECDFKTTEEYLWETYLHANTIIDSRSYGDNNDPHFDDDPHLIPLADLFNGASEWNPDGLAYTPRSNVAIEQKRWSSISGSHLANECNIFCNVIYALRDIEEGEELLVSGGPKSPIQCFFRYATVPLDLFKLNKPEHIGLLIPPYMIPNDARRILSLEKSGHFELEAFREGQEYVTCLWSEDYFINEKRCETRSVSSLLQFVLLGSIASNEEIEIYIKTGRLQSTSVSNESMCRALCKVIDYNLSILDSTEMSSSIKDYERANRIDIPFWEKNALLVKICERETLFMWRHHFCRRFKMISSDIGTHHSIHTELLIHQNKCCRICGRTYPIMKCTRCKGAMYCSRSHQVIDWKAGHKLTCRTQEQEKE